MLYYSSVATALGKSCKKRGSIKQKLKVCGYLSVNFQNTENPKNTFVLLVV